jgi:hypothetical protein
MHSYIIQGDIRDNMTTMEGNVEEVGIEHGTISYNARCYIQRPHIRSLLFPEVDHILKQFWLRIYINISFPAALPSSSVVKARIGSPESKVQIPLKI